MWLFLAALVLPSAAGAQTAPDKRFPLFATLTGKPASKLVTYSPSQLDPRQEFNQRRLPTSSIRADLKVLRDVFDGLVLYGYHEACTPRVLAIAKDLKFHVILLAVWDPKSAAETDGVAELAKQYENDFALGVLVGNEGITFKRYEPEDLTIAAARLRRRLPKSIPLGTSEPLVGYKQTFVRDFGDFLAPNIHPFFDRPMMGARAAAAWAREEATKLARQAKKPVILKETGSPHDGKDGFTPMRQQAFWQAYLQPGMVTYPDVEKTVWVFHGVAFEAFDLPWKSEESKLAVEKSWGLLSPKREPYPAWKVWKTAGRE
jgi:exo-beta-1,3-glucanase (GH17 family)